MRPLFTSACVVLLIVLVAGCTPTMSPEHVYHSDATDPTLGSAENVVVEQTPQGVQVSGSEISALALITGSSFKITTEPEDAELEYTVGEIKFDQFSGAAIVKANIRLGEGSTVPARLPMQGGTIFVAEMYGFVPGTSGSQNVSVRINPAVGHTDVAGLRFKEEVVLNIWEDGTVEVDEEGIVASDTQGNEWISKRAKLGDKTAVIMIRKE